MPSYDITLLVPIKVNATVTVKAANMTEARGKALRMTKSELRQNLDAGNRGEEIRESALDEVFYGTGLEHVEVLSVEKEEDD